MFNLQAVNNRSLNLSSPHTDTEGQETGNVSSIFFNERVIGSLGSTVIDETGGGNEEDDYDEEPTVEFEDAMDASPVDAAASGGCDRDTVAPEMGSREL